MKHILPQTAVRICSATVGYTNGAIQGESFYELPDGRIVIGSRGCPEPFYYETQQDYVLGENLSNKDIRFGVGDDVDDSTRSRLKPFVSLPTQAESCAKTAAVWRMVDQVLAEKAREEKGVLPELKDEPSEIPDPVNSQNCNRSGPNGQRPVRLRSRGLTVLIEENFEAVVKKHGGRVLGCDDAKGTGYVGSISCPLHELLFEFEGKRWFAYRLSCAEIDSWCEEVWTTDHRLSANAAADTILSARNIR